MKHTVVSNIPENLPVGYFKSDRFYLIQELVTKFGRIKLPFDTDGFTIPWFLRWFHNPYGSALVAAIWHDYALKRKDPLAHLQFLDLLLDYAYLEQNKNKKRWLIFKAYVMYFFVVTYAKWKYLLSYFQSRF